MSIHIHTASQFLPISIEEAWDFMSSPENLAKITPESMDFVIKEPNLPAKVYAGLIISYTVKPLWGIPVAWTTEITHVKEHEYFVDEQRFGPYSLWHHKHFLKAVEGGVQMDDIIHYKVPGGFFGDIINTLLVGKKVSEIFDYRYKKLEQLFPAK